jgi:hypothetical protein
MKGELTTNSETSTVKAIALMMAAVRTSETLVYFNETTRRYIPEGCHILCSNVFYNHPVFFYFYYRPKVKVKVKQSRNTP